MVTVIVLLYSGLVYAVFLGTIVFSAWWLARPAEPAAVGAWPVSAGVDLALLLVFAIQHTVMARAGFKRRLVRLLPAAAERSTFVLAASLALLLLYWQWRPLPGTVWDLPQPWAAAVLVAYGLGWALVLASTFMISHADFFGLRQGWLALRRRAYQPPAFVTRYAYAAVRHPLMSGFFIVFWAVPRMSSGHLLFSMAASAYIFVGVWFEERETARELGEPYARYRREVPAFVPRFWARR